MAGRYNRMWLRVHQVVSRAQKEVYLIVEEICGMVANDIGEFLEGLREEYGFTYVIEPMQGDGDIMRCVPCLYIEADEHVFEAVKKAVLERFPEVVSESRLVFERKPRQVEIE